MKENHNIPLFWWSEVRLMGKQKENYGDLLSRYIVEKNTEKKVEWIHPKKQPWYKLNKKNYLSIGSIIHHATTKSIVWGSGIIDRDQKISKASFRAVRGPKTKEYLNSLGYDCPAVYGDPAILLPLYFQPKVQKKYKFGIIPHYQDYKSVLKLCSETSYEDVLVIDLLCDDVEKVTEKILSCEKTISSSLHGLIVSHSYEIPSIWVEFSNKLFGDGIKFADYLESVGLPAYAPKLISDKITIELFEKLIQNNTSLPENSVIHQLQTGLLNSSPF
ncbi:polysaccharide pyruvyl transferase family protein [Christiangramia salexigens]|uniref:Exosortase n=1 Tax=Christiangramia salexigens TaxID=1913577 RepID=A0A1L3J4T1_9FLAO|nr:polysaccharide pyruvyl transferase family protein [Christiangramia salexigens]APG60126.1 exosortase [Christiangramia salexigens]